MEAKETQVVLRTHCDGYKSTGIANLQTYLSKGYTVAFVTPITHTDK